MTGRGSEAGFSLVALFAGVTIMMILMAAAMPSWKWVVQNEREQELFFRGNAIATAIERYQKKNGNAAPPSLEVLVKGKYLRQEYKDPMTKDGKWNFIRPGQVAGPRPPARPGAGQAGGAAPGHTTVPGANPPGLPGSAATVMTGNLGPFIGVASLSEEKSFRLMNGAETYDQWHFVAGRPRVLGKVYLAQPGVGAVPGAAPGAQPGAPGAPPGGPPTGPTKN